MHKLICCAVLIILCMWYEGCQAQDTIYWSPTYTLTWNDFRANPMPNTYYQALTSTGITYTVAYQSNITHFYVRAFFVRPNSWRKTMASEAVLKHEQGHFNITEIYARQLRRALQNFKHGHKNLAAAVNEIADEIIKEKNAFQKQYDAETHFGTDKEEQLCWEGWIAELLQ